MRKVDAVTHLVLLAQFAQLHVIEV
ncbi:hypothetical protein ACCD08_03025 [Telluria sp. Tellsp104]